LGTLGLIAQAGGFADIAGAPEKFEYWSLAKKDDAFGFVSEPIRKNPDKGILREDFLPTAKRFLDDALARWINGQEAFTARLNPDIGGYNDYDQLMRLDEWLGALDRETAMTQP
jgi:ATP-dependent helicase/nuclease subunit B